MQKPVCNPELALLQPIACKIPNDLRLPLVLENVLKDYPKTYQPAGEKYAWRYLDSFFAERITGYTRFISKPTESRYHSSRLSTYLAWGNLSSRQVIQMYQQEEKNGFSTRDLMHFRSRLQWRFCVVRCFHLTTKMRF